MEPTTAEDWMLVANDRAMDAEAIKDKQPSSALFCLYGWLRHRVQSQSFVTKTRYSHSDLWERGT